MCIMDERLIELSSELQTLLLASSDPNEVYRGISPLCTALRKRCVDAFSLLLQSGPIPINTKFFLLLALNGMKPSRVSFTVTG